MKLSDSIPKKIFDQSASTIKELVDETGQGSAWIRNHAQSMVDSGDWEAVWKVLSGHHVPAYRRKKGKNK